MRERGGGLLIREGDPARQLTELARNVGASEVHATADITPFSRRRDGEVKRVLNRAGIDLHLHPGVAVVDDLGAIRTGSGTPYTVFSPFHRSWESEARREVLEAPGSLPSPPSGLALGTLPSLRSLGLQQAVADPAPGGETAALERLEGFLYADVADYGEEHDALGADRTSRLSPYLHFGCVSPRDVEDRLGHGRGPAAFRRQLAWRDFYHHVLLHFPRNAHSEFRERYRGIRWSRAKRPFAAWCEGHTGYPIVDAAMRQLRHEGWIHNRGRLVAGSFLTKDLGIDWRWGERHFMTYLLDGDEANNNGNWQWIGSVGTDTQPPYRRIYNPARQMETHDPTGAYVRRYVPELERVPDEYLREPWRMPQDVQHEVGCVIGVDYPEPIVDHAQARREALDRYGSALG
jgi:deoxyribodipyrimidine photo-lyase